MPNILLTPGRVNRWLIFLTLLVGLGNGTNSYAETKYDIRVDNARLILSDFRNIPERAIPPALLDQAAGIAIIPNVLKVGLGFGARFGRGVVLKRTSDGQWQPPLFVTFSSGSVGWQIGAQAADLVLVFRDAATLEKIRRAKFTMGADAAVAAGPVGRYTSAGTDIRFEAPVYSYSVSQGLFAGVSLDGAVLKMDYKGSARFYREPGVSLETLDILPAEKIPASAQALLSDLNIASPGTRDSTVPAALPESDEDAPVRTFGIGESPIDDNDAPPNDNNE